MRGVGMPGHFLAQDAAHPEVWCDPFHGGRLYDADILATRDLSVHEAFDRMASDVPDLVADGETAQVGGRVVLTGVVVAEFFFATAGVGFMISVASQGFDTAKVLLGVLIFSLAGVVTIGMLQRIEKRMAPWRLP